MGSFRPTDRRAAGRACRDCYSHWRARALRLRRLVAAAVCAEQVIDLIDHGVEDLHFDTMNRADLSSLPPSVVEGEAEGRGRGEFEMGTPSRRHGPSQSPISQARDGTGAAVTHDFMTALRPKPTALSDKDAKAAAKASIHTFARPQAASSSVAQAAPVSRVRIRLREVEALLLRFASLDHPLKAADRESPRASCPFATRAFCRQGNVKHRQSRRSRSQRLHRR